jgi:predicted CoA-substrate-specific enzyme activase
MDSRKNFLGIDIGSVSIAVAVIDENKNLIQSSYVFHKGDVRNQLLNVLKGIDLTQVISTGYTSSTPGIIKRGKKTDSRIAFINAAKHFHPDLNSLLIIGAEKFGLACFDKNGEYLNYKSNTSCAAGTGNFLEQQAERLNLKDIREFSELALNNKGSFPKIASRCAVFAKTDLIHAQQEGYSLSEICDGLSWGIAKNIVDTVFHNRTFSEVVAAGGVSLNKAVIRHIEKLAHLSIIVDECAHIYGAIGAALNCLRDETTEPKPIRNENDLIDSEVKDKNYHYPPLKLKLSDYPDFTSLKKYEFKSGYFPSMKPVEVDIYSFPEINTPVEIILGVDIGSTSTKAILLSKQKEVIAGLYTRTPGQPLQAVQVLFEAIRDMEEKENIRFVITGSGTTGAGRNFVGKILGADLILDEISAHARAAWELDPETDTIIEIGGQDSKFTLMHDGMVTFSVMNNVCAAGTGSFIEEQAKRLGCPLSEYSSRAENASSPLANDRCTVFMERDLSHYLKGGYGVDEMLAAVLHSTRENYLTKVAVRSGIGKKIFFQGATARNKALVAAFEQKLNKPIMVSRFCHLTGALGIALELNDRKINSTKFRGLDICKKDIPIRSEVCELCTNHCKLKIAEIDDEIEAYGFLCGRDYHDHKFIKNRSIDFQLIRKRKELFRFKPSSPKKQLTIGIPAGLHLFEEIPFWRKFFDLLSINTISSEECYTAVKVGKNLCDAEFCAPLAAMHGHVDFLLGKADYVFLPVYLEELHETKFSKQYCYYTQFVSSVISIHKHFQPREKILTPLLKTRRGELLVQFELYQMLKTIGHPAGFHQVVLAYENAKHYSGNLTDKWKALYENQSDKRDDIHVVLLGRPYTVLSPIMNNHIPDIIEKYGIRTYYMDMLPINPSEISRGDELARIIRWKFASRILHAAEYIAKTKGCYAVFVTSFKCSPDSFAIEYFKEIFNSYNKPYLILQLDEHDSAVGYETRIEAGIRSFRNHFLRQGIAQKETNSLAAENSNSHIKNNGNSLKHTWENHIMSLISDANEILKTHGIDFKYFSNLVQRIDVDENDITGSIVNGVDNLKHKTLLIPSWDSLTGPLLEAVLLNSEIDARLVSASGESIHRSLSYNTGQCLPLNIIVQDAIDYIAANNLDPSQTVLWVPKSNLSCNLSMFPYYSQKLLKDHGNGMEKVSVYPGDFIFYDVSLQTAINAYLAYMFGGYIRKIGCRIRPYEKKRGRTDKVIQQSFELLRGVFKSGHNKEEALTKVISDFEHIQVEKTNRPRVAIFGDLYVRDNDLMNQDLIKTVEENGGEVITTPYSEYLKIVVNPMTERSFQEGRFLDYAKIRFLKSLIPLVEEKYNKYFARILGEPRPENGRDFNDWLTRFNLNILHRGESLENILKIHSLLQHNPDLGLFIQTNPSYCCPSLVTEAMASTIEEITGVPVVTIEYDGTSGIKNESVIPYLMYGKKNKVNLHF